MPIADIPVVTATAEHDCGGGESFALMVLGDAMAPEFDSGDIVIVEPDGLARDGSFVIAWCDGGWALRRLVRQEDRWRLEVLNPAAADATPPVVLADLAGVRGVVIQKSRPGRRRSLKRYVE